jgi:hypothetical protein
VLITVASHRLMSGMFVVEDLGAQTLKGIELPIQLYRVVQPSGMRGPLEATASVRGLTTFVGREDELRLLMNRWERARSGEGQVALIIGEAGIGKSRLMQRLHEQIAGTPQPGSNARRRPSIRTRPSIRWSNCCASWYGSGASIAWTTTCMSCKARSRSGAEGARPTGIRVDAGGTRGDGSYSAARAAPEPHLAAGLSGLIVAGGSTTPPLA